MVNNPGPSRQQVTGSSAQQPFISGFPTNQPMHPQMSQQSMFGLGPRLPLSAINPSSSSGAHPMLRPVSGSRTECSKIIGIMVLYSDIDVASLACRFALWTQRIIVCL
ncbi:hypothetical protein Tco_0959912 [Tanacetum coccineum]